MSFFGPSAYYEPNFSGLFRLIDDFDRYAEETGQQQQGGRQVQRRGHGTRAQLPTFTPKFDLRETETAYELHGELPGIDKQDVNIEFNDEQTITIRGKVERSYQNEDTGDERVVEEQEEEKEKEQTSTEVTKTEAKDKQVSAARPRARYWVSERSVGEFARSFNFPARVNTEAVTASMKDGILSVTVPKATKPASRRITVQ